LNSSKALILQIVTSTSLLIIIAALLVWLPNFAEEKASLNKPLSERVALIEKAIEKTKSNPSIDKSGIINVFELQIESEKATDAALNSVVSVFKPFTVVLALFLFFHIMVLVNVVKHLRALKT
jgi:hypothetical protein